MILDALAASGYSVAFEDFGDGPFVSFCTIVRSNGAEVVGGGRSAIDQSTARLIAAHEAVEHASLGYDLSHLDRARGYTGDVKATDLARFNSPPFSRIIGEASISLTQDLFYNDNLEAISVPRFLYNPDFKYTGDELNCIKKFDLGRYSTNSGVSCHKDITSAKLHGALEVIERDAIGLTILRSIIGHYPLRQIRLSRTQPKIFDLSKTIQENLRCNVSVYDVTSCDIGIPVVLVGLTANELLGIISFGSAASLDPSEALERALLEAVQILTVDRHFPEERPALPDQQGSLLYRACLEGGSFVPRREPETVEIDQFISGFTSTNCLYNNDNEACLKTMVSKVRKRGHEIYWRSLISPAKDTKVVATVFPSLERFHLLARGRWVIPGTRGQDELERFGYSGT